MPKYMNKELPQWFTENKTQEFSEKNKIVMDWSDPYRLIPQYVMAEYLRKIAEIPMIKVYLNYNRFTISEKELKAVRNGIRDIVRLYIPFINLEFQPIVKSNFDIAKFGGNAESKKGINIYITEGLDNIIGESVNGYALSGKRLIFIDRDRLTAKDEKDRGMINAFSATTSHELSHIFGHYLDDTDKTHKYDYEFTLLNYIAQLPFYRLNTDDKKKFGFE